ELRRILQVRGDWKAKAGCIIRLFLLQREALNQRKTYEELAGYLDDDNLAVRKLAFWHLQRLGASGRLPEQAKLIEYDPTWAREQRQPALGKWRKLIADGKVPFPSPR